MGVYGVKSERKHLQDIKDLYIAEFGENYTLEDVIRWAIDEKHIQQSSQSMVRFWAQKMSAALGDETYTDPQGRTCRKNIAYRGKKEGEKKQSYFWCLHSTATPEQMDGSVKLRKRQMVQEGVKLQTDVDSYNENNKFGAEIQLCLDLRAEVEEAMQDEEYDPGVAP